MIPTPIVYVIDDEVEFANSVVYLVNSVGQEAKCFNNASDFLKNADFGRPGCVLLDLRLPGMSGLELQSRLLENGVEMPLIFVTAYPEVRIAVNAMKAGAFDFFEKSATQHDLLDRIQRAIAHDIEAWKGRLRRDDFKRRLESLTQRELEVMELVANGDSSRETGEKLQISAKTVESHRTNILRKMGVRNVTHLARLLREQGYEFNKSFPDGAVE